MLSCTAYNRFGLGAAAGAGLLADPVAWLQAQTKHLPQRTGGIVLAATPDLLAQLRRYAMARREARSAVPDAAALAKPGAGNSGLGNLHQLQVAARLASALTTATPFAERLVHFWANHFAVSADKAKTRVLAGAYEDEAIRPHVNGRFADLLAAAVQHPAMILYLDNERSVGPASRAAVRRLARADKALADKALADKALADKALADKPLGLNENLAREVLELHTLGVRSVYAQADVTELARALTGWSVAAPERMAQLDAEPADFGAAFYPALHEPGARTVLGRRYPEAGAGQGRDILSDLARHPATATHIATKLVCHFIADVPPPDAVAALARAFLASDGHLPTVYAALLALPQASEPALQKFKTPWEFVISSLRLLGKPEIDAQAQFAVLRAMGQPPMAPGSPAGWPDNASRWLSSDAMARRIAFATRLGATAGPGFDARATAAQLFGPSLSAPTRAELDRADSSSQALTLLLASPEFMRR